MRLKGLIEEVCHEQRIEILGMDIKPNYVYLHADMPPLEPVNSLIRKIKRKSSRVLCEEYPELTSRLPSLWTLHYFVSTEEEKPEEEIRRWMQTQPRFITKKG